MSSVEVDEQVAESTNIREDCESGANPSPFQGAVIGLLVGLREDGRTPLVVFPGQVGTAAVAANTVVDVHGSHVGRQVVLVFENANACQPVIVGCLQRARAWPLSPQDNHVEVEADGERLVLTARERLVLRCGKASITLTKSGKVLIEGEYVSSRSSGLNRIKGGSIQLN